MEINGLWESEKSHQKVYVVTEYCCDDYTPIIHTIVCASYLEAHFEFKDIVEEIKKACQDCIDDTDNYVCEEEDDYFDLYEDGDAANFERNVWISETKVVSYT